MDISSLAVTGQHFGPVPTPVPPNQAAENRQLIKTVKALNATQYAGDNHEFTFSVDRATKRPVIRIVDTNTNEVLQQFPAEYLLRLTEDANSAGA